jgi:hypothetical protein
LLSGSILTHLSLLLYLLEGVGTVLAIGGESVARFWPEKVVEEVREAQLLFDTRT